MCSWRICRSLLWATSACRLRWGFFCNRGQTSLSQKLNVIESLRVSIGTQKRWRWRALSCLLNARCWTMSCWVTKSTTIRVSSQLKRTRRATNSSRFCDRSRASKAASTSQLFAICHKSKSALVLSRTKLCSQMQKSLNLPILPAKNRNFTNRKLCQLTCKSPLFSALMLLKTSERAMLTLNEFLMRLNWVARRAVKSLKHF